jgi:conjugative relaxase-like TrwC/TraI family protein
VLTINEVTSASHAKDYYAVADYYSEGQETVGEWGGKLAEWLGQSGRVTEEAFGRMVDNLDPMTGERLTARTNAERRVGYDFTVSLNKSASILRAFAGEDDAIALDAARDRAIAGMMAEVEADMQTRVRLGGMDADRTTGNMAWAAFHHSTSRPVDGQPPDMNQHVHLLVFNATYDPVERRIKAGQFGGLKRDGEYYSAVFDSLYARELEKLGYVIDRQGGKKWEVAGITPSMIDTFSKRKDEVEDAARRLGITDPALKAELGAKTRSKKQKELTMPELREAWAAQLTDDERDALARVYAREIPAGREVTAAEAVEYAIAHLSEQQSTFDVREFKAAALRHGLGSVTPERIDREMASPAHGLVAGDLDGREAVTTEALRAEERYIVGQAARGRGAVCPVGVPDGLTRTLADGRTLNEEQWQVTQGLLSTSNRVSMVKGPAGAGKSYSLQKFDEGMRMAGETPTYLATTATAVKVLARDGFEVNTVARFLVDEKMQEAARGGRVVVDEASMLGHKEAVKLFKLGEQLNLKFIFVGDPAQHGSVPRGAFMRILEEYAGIQSFRLTKLMRQQDPEYRAAAQSLSEGKTLAGFEALEKKGWVKEIDSDAERYRAMAAEYLQAANDGASCLVVSPTHAEAAAITREIRHQLREAWKLGGEEREFTRLVQVNASEAERSQATTYRPGDVIQFHQNARGGFVKGQRVVVTDRASAPLDQAGKFSLYRPESVMLAAGDRIRFTGTVAACKSDHKHKNGDTFTVAGFTEGGNLRLDDGRVVEADAGHFRPAFVETSFGAQGQTVQRVILGMSSASLAATNQEQMYVSASRARERMTLYTDDKGAVKSAIVRSSQKTAALDVQPPPHEKSRHWDRLQEERDRRQRLAWLKQRRATPAPPMPPLSPPPRKRPPHADRVLDSQHGREIHHGR